MPMKFKLEDWLPMEPNKGPPLPDFLQIFWPWYTPPGTEPGITTPTDITFTVAITNAEVLDQRAAEVFEGYGCLEPCGMVFGTWEELLAHARVAHPEFYEVLISQPPPEPPRGQWMPQVIDVKYDSYMSPDTWLGIDQTAKFTIPARNGYWDPEYPYVTLRVTGGPREGYDFGVLGAGTVELYPGCQVTFDYATKEFTVS